jgi:hypothetical protein
MPPNTLYVTHLFFLFFGKSQLQTQRICENVFENKIKKILLPAPNFAVTTFRAIGDMGYLSNHFLSTYFLKKTNLTFSSRITSPTNPMPPNTLYVTKSKMHPLNIINKYIKTIYNGL